MTSIESNPGAWITERIEAFCAGPENHLHDGSGEPAWGVPLVGFCAGDDDIYARYKEVVGPFHWTPLEAFAVAYPDTEVSADELVVISWVLPQTALTKRDSRAERTYPPERWARSRIYGEQVNVALRRAVVDALHAQGVQAMAPMLSEQWGTRPSEAYHIASTWSERHAAHAAGLGTFGLCDGLITPVGKAMRVGSAIARLAIPPTPRPYSDHHAYCLFYAKGTCGACMERCPVGAVTAGGHDKVVCSEHLSKTRRYVPEHYGFAGYGCGLCQTGVPCESGIPAGIEIDG